jgi:hypothetical protein
VDGTGLFAFLDASCFKLHSGRRVAIHEAAKNDPGGAEGQIDRESLVVLISANIGAVNPDNITNTSESGQLIIIMSEEGHAHTAVVGIVGVAWLLVVHRRIHDFEQLTVKVLLLVGRGRINHHSIEVVELGVTQGGLGEGRVDPHSHGRGATFDGLGSV